MKILRQLKNIYHWAVSWAAHAYYGFPARKLKLIGITGTDGKTTTSSLIYHVLKYAGKKVSVITTVSATIGGVSQDTGFHVTTPDPHQIPKLLAQAVAHGDEYMVFEITSHGLDQHRAAPMRFEVSGITNVTHEHLDYHRTMDRYLAAKAKLISLSKLTFINADQDNIKQKLKSLSKGHMIKTYGLKHQSDVTVDIANKFNTPLESYNKYNFLLAYSICKHLGVTDDDFGLALKSYSFPPGRMEVVYDKQFTAIIDFAHTPNAIREALSAISQKYPNRRIIHVFGAAGKRDQSKRTEMGESSGMYATKVILTEEDYRTEDPQKIADMIAVGLDKAKFQKVTNEVMRSNTNTNERLYTFVPNREMAVKTAISIARDGDVLVFTGKAHETTLCRGNTEYPYNEHDTCMKYIQECKMK
jgi:UDP-N-acetylmuramoyl-L-alanyl-D-glutamate--2,6-diaminopimelate ligase